MRLCDTLSPWRHTQTKLGITLFAIMIKRLLPVWRLRCKYVDDTTIFEIIPNNSISLLGLTVRDMHDYCIDHSMKLNLKTCKEMVVNFMGNPCVVMRPLSVGNCMIERVSSYKLLGVIIREDLKWNDHCQQSVQETLCPSATKKSRCR